MKTTPGYSGTPLAKKLGIKPGMHVAVIDAPEGYADWLAALPAEVVFRDEASTKANLVHVFVNQKAALASKLKSFRKELASESVIWVSWPKKAPGVATDVTEDVIREVALPLGYVDVKVCAVSDVWSGLKLVVRKELR